MSSYNFGKNNKMGKHYFVNIMACKKYTLGLNDELTQLIII